MEMSETFHIARFVVIVSTLDLDQQSKGNKLLIELLILNWSTSLMLVPRLCP